MGFWESFLGHAAVEVAKDMKRQEKETQRWNDLFHELGQYETVFNNYLSSVGIQDVRQRIEIGANCILNSRLLPTRLRSYTGNCTVQEGKLQLLVALF